MHLQMLIDTGHLASIYDPFAGCEKSVCKKVNISEYHIPKLAFLSQIKVFDFCYINIDCKAQLPFIWQPLIAWSVYLYLHLKYFKLRPVLSLIKLLTSWPQFYISIRSTERSRSKFLIHIKHISDRKCNINSFRQLLNIDVNWKIMCK